MQLKRHVLLGAFLLVTLLFGLSCAPAGAQAPGHTLTGEVVAVKDGDTIDVLPQESPWNGQTVTVHLYGIDAPEIGQPFGMAARGAAITYVFGRVVRVRVTAVERYGRAAGQVEIGGGILGEMMVRDGLAWWYRHYAPDDVELERLERQARQAARGLWGRESPIPPWEWRQGTRPGREAPSSGSGSGVSGSSMR